MANADLSPKQLREAFRNDLEYSTYGSCPGYFQANIAILPSLWAEKFSKFCNCNNAPCPVVYQSKPGEVGCVFAENSDIRTDLPGYNIFKEGQKVEEVKNVLSIPWEDMVTFYIGCSFSFDDKLFAIGIKQKSLGNVPMYETNIACIPIPPFHSCLIVSMRPVLQSQLQQAVQITMDFDYCHGAPIHIGAPGDLGINDLNVGIGGKISLDADEVPVFWACGVTSQKALLNGKPPISFSHQPSKMFISDTNSDEVQKNIDRKPHPLVICLDEKLKRYSILSEPTFKTLSTIENEILEDLGHRNIEHLFVKDDFHKACLSLSKNAVSVAIILGFPVFETGDVKEENDGIAGAIYIAKVLLYLDRQVTFFIDSHSTCLKAYLENTFVQGFLSKQVSVLSVGKDFLSTNKEFLISSSSGKVNFSHMISIERPSPSIKGGYKTMTGRDISPHCEPLDVLFEQGNAHKDVVTISIGDGGNEIGMGKVQEQVIANIPHGDVIASSVSCDYLVVCGVSNWGGCAIAAGLYALGRCPLHERFARNGIGFKKDRDVNDYLMTEAVDEKLHESITKDGFRDGVTGLAAATVDGLPYHVHATKLKRLRTACDV